MSQRDSISPRSASIGRLNQYDPLSHPLTPEPIPRYVPYTPRQRSSPVPKTTHATHGHTETTASTSRPLIDLKASAKAIGLDAGTIGLAILERLVVGSGTTSRVEDEWAEIWESVTNGKATLILPLDPLPSSSYITPSLVRNHVLFMTASQPREIMTMSGIRGFLSSGSDSSHTLTLRSSLPPTSPIYPPLLDPITRASGFTRLPPLPSIPTSPGYPTYPLSQPTESFVLPSRVKKPSLPPRPVAPVPSNPAAAGGASGGGSRMSGLASLFGVKPSLTPTSVPPPSPPLPTSAQEMKTSSHSDSSTLEKENQVGVEETEVYPIQIYTTPSPIPRGVGREINDAIKAEIIAGVPEEVVEKVLTLVEDVGLLPFKIDPEWSREKEKARIGKAMGLVAGKPRSLSSRKDVEYEEEVWAINDTRGAVGTIDLVGEKFQAFYQSFPPPPSSLQSTPPLEHTEATLTTIFYNTLFLQSPPLSTDSAHDEILTERVAALNMLDLGLEHLGIDIGKADKSDVDRVVKSCGESLTKLEEAKSPADKSKILVEVHRVVVDGLSKLPPIGLKAAEDVPPSPAPSLGTAAKEDESTPAAENGVQMAENPILPKSAKESSAVVTLPISELDIPTVVVSPHDSSPPHPPLDKPTPVSGDILLPLIIFSVVKANPPHLVSHLLYTQRFRNQISGGGEESYCLVNLMAVAEFLENVDLEALGLSGGESRVIGAGDLSPLPLITPEKVGFMSEGLRLRGRMEQQVDAIAGSANKVISGVVDSSFGVLKALLPLQYTPSDPTNPQEGLPSSAPWNAMRPNFGLLRRESGFSIANLAASLPGAGREKTKSPRGEGEESGQQLVSVSRPGSVKSAKSAGVEDSSDEETDEEVSEGGEESGEDDGYQGVDQAGGGGHDSRSIRSFESMMSKGAKEREWKIQETNASAAARKSLSDRLAGMSGMGRLQSDSLRKGSPPTSRPTSLLPSGPSNRFDTPSSPGPQSPTSIRIPPPNRRFVECHEDDLKVSEVPELLREYKRLVEGVKAMGGFDE